MATAEEHHPNALIHAGKGLAADLLSSIVFAGLLAVIHDAAVATGIAIVVGVAQLGYTLARGRKPDAMQSLSLVLVMGFGGASLILHDPRFIMFKPSLIYVAVGVTAQTFINASGTMQVRKLPFSFHSLLVCDEVLINFAHQLVAFWVVTAILRLFPVPHWQLLFTLPLVMLVGFLLSFPLGMVSVRYRDMSYFISLVLQAAFMLTSVFWRRSQIPTNRHWIVDWNPLAHMLEIPIQPLLGHPAPMEYLIGARLPPLYGSSSVATQYGARCRSRWRSNEKLP